MTLSETRKGELYAFSEIFLWSFFPIVSILSFAKLPSLISFGWSAIFAAVFFACVVTYRRTWNECRSIELWKYLFFISLCIAVLYYVFFFLGLRSTSAGNAALVSEFEIFTTFFFFHIVRREYISSYHVLGAVCMVLGVAIVLVPQFSGFERGDLLILLATVFPPLGNLYQQKARLIASSETILFLRTILSIPIIFLLASLLGEHADLTAVRSSLLLLVINGAILLGWQKMLFLEAIHRVPIPKVIALGALTPFLTLVLAWFLVSQSPNIWQLTALVPLITGALLLTDQIRQKNRRTCIKNGSVA